MTITQIPIIRLNEMPIAKAATRVVLKNIRTAKSLDGGSFSATIYIDGTKVGEVMNAGHGGPNEYVPARGHTLTALHVVAVEWADKAGQDGSYIEIDDLFVEELMNHQREQKDADKMLAKRYDVVVRFDRKPMKTEGPPTFLECVQYGLVVAQCTQRMIQRLAEKDGAARIRIIAFSPAAKDAVAALGDSLDIGV